MALLHRQRRLPARETDGNGTMVTLGEQLQLSRHLAATITAQRAGILNAWLRGLRDIPRDFAGRLPEAHLEEFTAPTLDALIAYLARGDRKSLRRLAVRWAKQQDRLGVGLGESIRAILALGPAAAPTLRRAGLERGQAQVESFLALLAEEVSRAYTSASRHHFTEKTRATQAAEERLLSLQTVAGAVAQERDPERTLELIAREVLKLTGAAEAAVFLPDDDDRFLRPVVSIAPDGFSHDGAAEAIESTLLGHVYRSGHLLVANDPEAPRLGEATRSTLIAPLRTQRGVIGVLGVRQLTGESFTRGDVELLGLFADQAAIALENARLFRESERRGEDLGILYQIGTIANRSLDLDRVLNDVLDYILEARDLQCGSIYLLDKGGTKLEPRTQRGLATDGRRPLARINPLAGIKATGNEQGAASEEDQVAQEGPALPSTLPGAPASIPVGDGPIGRVAATGELLCIDDAEPIRQLLPVGTAEGVRRYYGIPLRVKGRVLGVLNIFSHHEVQPEAQPGELALLTSIGDQVGVAIDNANLLVQREERLDQLATLNDILRAISANLDLDSLYDAMYAGCSRLFDTTNFYIAIHHPVTGERTTHHWYKDGQRLHDHEGTPIVRGLCPLVMDGRQPIRTADYWAECERRGIQGSPRLTTATPLAWLGVPMIAGDRVTGAIVVASNRHDYTAEDVTLLGAIASGCAVALENAQLYASSRELATAEERNRLAREIHDTLAQGLTAVALHLEVADALLDAPERLPEARENVHKALALTRANLEEARRSVMDLRASALQNLSLSEALNQLVYHTAREHGFEACYRNRGVEGRLPAWIEAGFYRIAQELLSNVAKHAHATQVDMTLERCGDSLVLTLADDGIGFDPAAPRAPGISGGFGLIGLRERIALLGGALEVDTAPDEGTRVRVTVPLEVTGDPSWRE